MTKDNRFRSGRVKVRVLNQIADLNLTPKLLYIIIVAPIQLTDSVYCDAF